MRISIRAKLLLSFLLILSFGAGVSFYFILVAEQALQNAVGTSSVFLAEDLMERIDKEIFDKVEQIQLYTKDASLQAALQESNASFEKFADVSEYITDTDQAWRAVAQGELSPLMQELIENKVSDTLRQEFLEFWMQKYAFYAYGEAFVTNAYGANIAQTGRTSDYYQADEEWWQQARERGFFVNDIEYDESAQSWTMPIGVRIEDSKGSFLGVLKAIPLAQELFRQAELTGKRYETTEMKLLTKEGYLIYSTSPFDIFDDRSQEESFQQAKEGNGFFVSQEEGKEKLFSYTQSVGFGDFPGFGWVLLISHDTKEVFSPIQDLKRTAGITGLGIFALTFFFVVVLARTISLPLRKLTGAVEYIGKGNFMRRLVITSEDEIGKLARSFNEMSSRLQESHESLERKVKERTKELQERVGELDKTAKLLVRRDFEALQTTELLREMDEAKSRFVSIAAHQLRTPLTGIKWTMQMLLSGDFGKLAKDQKSVLKEAYGTLQRLIGLVRDLLSVARIEEGRALYKFSSVQMEEVAKKVFDESVVAAESKGITLKLTLPEKLLPKVSGDLTNLVMVLQNIVDNAITYTEKGGLIEIGIKRYTRDKKRIKVFVRDTGIGIPASQRTLIGQKFFRGDNVVRSQVYGSGLGLYIVKRILERHDGNLEFTSKEGKGSAFFFTLPFSQQDTRINIKKGS